MQFIMKKKFAFLIEEKDLKNKLFYLIKEIYKNNSILEKLYKIKVNILTKMSTTILIKN